MADEREEQTISAQREQAGDGGADRECMPCRGSGKVISNLGGEEHTVDCPWCEGSGQRILGIDAQAHRRAKQSGPDAAAAAAQSNGAS